MRYDLASGLDGSYSTTVTPYTDKKCVRRVYFSGVVRIVCLI